MDVLSEILTTLRLEAALYFRADLRGPFAVRLSEERRRIRFHLLLEGQCHVTVPDAGTARLDSGDLVLIPDGAAQILASAPDIGPPADLADILRDTPPTDGVLALGADGPACRLLCGFLHFDEALDHPILTALPPMMVLRTSDPAHAAALRLLRDEADRPHPGDSFVLHRIVEILLIQFARDRAADGDRQGGFVAALRDPKLAAILRAIHREPHRNWTVARLADRAAMSRSAFAERFAATVGVSPISYLTLWRMTKAREMLMREGLAMAEIAELCGYSSVPAFARRFTATFGTGPGAWRKRRLWRLSDEPGR